MTGVATFQAQKLVCANKDQGAGKQLVKGTTENKPAIELKTAKAEGARWIRNRRLIWKYKRRQVFEGY